MANLVVPLMLAGTVVSAIGSTQAATATKNAALYNARLEEINAFTATDQTQADVSRFRRTAAQALGAQRAAFGATGNSEDALSVLADTASQYKLDELTMKYKGDLRVLGHESSAQLNRLQADTAEREGGYRTASALITGVGNTAVYSTAGSARLNRGPAGSISRSFLVD